MLVAMLGRIIFSMSFSVMRPSLSSARTSPKNSLRPGISTFWPLLTTFSVSFTDDQSLITQPRNPSSPRRMRRIRSAFCPAHSPLRRL